MDAGGLSKEFITICESRLKEQFQMYLLLAKLKTNHQILNELCKRLDINLTDIDFSNPNTIQALIDHPKFMDTVCQIIKDQLVALDLRNRVSSSYKIWAYKTIIRIAGTGRIIFREV